LPSFHVCDVVESSLDQATRLVQGSGDADRELPGSCLEEGYLQVDINHSALEKGETLDRVTIKLRDGHEVSLLELLKELGEV